ncbi:MAG: hypothetical protein ACM33V_00945 [Chloroflexota bacterium]
MTKKPYSQILDSIARDHVAEHPDLAARILTQVQKGKGATMRPRMKVFVTAVLILLVLMTVLVSVPAVRAAIQRWFGYVPGVGLVSEGQMRVLAEPVSMQREGFTLTVEKVVVDSTRTTVLYKVEGLTEENADYGEANQHLPECMESAFLRFPGNELSLTDQGGPFWGTGYETRTSYPVIPVEVNEITFVLPCIDHAITGKAPEDWEVPLRLIPAPPEMTVFPVIEIATPMGGTPTPASQSGRGFTAEGISLTLDRAVQMDDGYLLYATVHWENKGFDSLDILDETTVHLWDVNGQAIPFMFDYDALADVNRAQGQTAIVIRTAPIQVAGPLRLTLDSVAVLGPVDARFTFDPGPDPQPGQTWKLNQLVDMGYGHSLRVLSATYPTPVIEGQPQTAGLSFEMDSDTGVGFAMLVDREHPRPAGGGGSYGSFTPPFTADVSYAGEFPEGPLNIDIILIGLNLPGPWEAQWTPPISEAQASATPQPQACLNRESWQQALSKREPIPDGLGGKLAIADVPPPDYYYKVFVVNLDGSDHKSVGLGDSPSLSPDGTRVAHVGPMTNGPADGLYITDLASGDTALLPGTTTGDRAPLWSPDGTRIAFTRGPALIGAPGAYNVAVVNVDGSDPRQLTSGSDQNYALAWLPDGNRIVVGTTNQAGGFLQIIDVRTGAVEFLSNVTSDGAVSPDLKRIAFREMLPLDKFGLFVSNLDGSDRRRLADGDPYVATVPFWSPDGKWVVVSVHDPDTNKQPNPMLALIQVDTCQIIPLPDLGGYVSSWLP